MFELSQLFTEPKAAIATVTTMLLGWLHISHGKKINELEDGKVDRVIYKKDKALHDSNHANSLHEALDPIKEGLGEVQLNLRFFMKSQGMDYQENKKGK